MAAMRSPLPAHVPARWLTKVTELVTAAESFDLITVVDAYP